MATKQPLGRRAYLNAKKNAGEVHDTPALSIIGPKIKGIRLSADDKIKQAIRNLRQSDQAEFDTFEEADDFDVGEEEDNPLSGYENEFEEMEPDQEFPKTGDEPEQKKEEKEKSAPKEALKKGADEQKPSD